MKIGNQADKCLSFIRCNLESEPKLWLPRAKLAPAVTLSRQTGCGARAIAEELAEYLRAHEPTGQRRWTVFDKALVEKILEEHKLPKEVAKYMPEDRVSAIQDAVEELLGLHPASRTLVRQSSETILHLAEHGYGILIGRAGNLITRHLRNVFHVRLVAPLEWRVERIMARNHLDAKAAGEFIRKSDLGRERYLKDYFHADIDDCCQYNLVVNTGRLPDQVVARMIGDATVHWAGSQ